MHYWKNTKGCWFKLTDVRFSVNLSQNPESGVVWCSTELIVHCSIGTLNYSRQVSMHPGVDTCCCIMLWVKLMVIVTFGRKYFICEVDVNRNDATVNCKIVRYKLSSSKLDLFYYPMHYSSLDVCNHLRLLTHVPNFSLNHPWYDTRMVDRFQQFSTSPFQDL